MCLLLATSAHGEIVRFVIEGDTQDWADYHTGGGWTGGDGVYHPVYTFDDVHPTGWDKAHDWFCAQKAALNIKGLIGTGDVTNGPIGRDPAPPWNNNWDSVDFAYDKTDACGITTTLPAGNHDNDPPVDGPPWTFNDYLAWRDATRVHDPAVESPSRLSWLQPLVGPFSLIVLPFAADASEKAWAQKVIEAAGERERFFVIQHDAVDPGVLPQLSTRVAGQLAAQYGPKKIPLVIGGHFIPDDKVQTGVASNGVRGLMVNFQHKMPPPPGQSCYQQPDHECPLFWGWFAWLTYETSTGEWCFEDANALTGEKNVYQARTCFTPDSDGDGIGDGIESGPTATKSATALNPGPAAPVMLP